MVAMRVQVTRLVIRKVVSRITRTKSKNSRLSNNNSLNNNKTLNNSRNLSHSSNKNKKKQVKTSIKRDHMKINKIKYKSNILIIIIIIIT